jgi:hypothetical protein
VYDKKAKGVRLGVIGVFTQTFAKRGAKTYAKSKCGHSDKTKRPFT